MWRKLPLYHLKKTAFVVIVNMIFIPMFFNERSLNHVTNSSYVFVQNATESLDVSERSNSDQLVDLLGSNQMVINVNNPNVELFDNTRKLNFSQSQKIASFNKNHYGPTISELLWKKANLDVAKLKVSDLIFTALRSQKEYQDEYRNIFKKTYKEVAPSLYATYQKPPRPVNYFPEGIAKLYSNYYSMFLYSKWDKNDMITAEVSYITSAIRIAPNDASEYAVVIYYHEKGSTEIKKRRTVFQNYSKHGTEAKDEYNTVNLLTGEKYGEPNITVTKVQLWTHVASGGSWNQTYGSTIFPKNVESFGIGNDIYREYDIYFSNKKKISFDNVIKNMNSNDFNGYLEEVFEDDKYYYLNEVIVSGKRFKKFLNHIKEIVSKRNETITKLYVDSHELKDSINNAFNVKFTPILNNSYQIIEPINNLSPINLTNSANIALLYQTQPIHWYQSFLNFLAKQLLISKKSGVGTQENPVNNGVYNKQNADRVKLKFAFRDEFAYLVNLLNLHNEILKSDSSRAETFKLIASGTSNNTDPFIKINDNKFLNNFFNFRYSYDTLTKLLDYRSNHNGNLNKYNNLVDSTSDLFAKNYKLIFDSDLPVLYSIDLLDKEVSERFINSERRTIFNSLLDLPSLVAQSLKNKRITANVNYGAKDRNQVVTVWNNNQFVDIEPYPLFEHFDYLNPKNDYQNRIDFSILKLHFDDTISSDDSKEISIENMPFVLQEFNDAHRDFTGSKTIQNTLSVTENEHGKKLIKYQLNYQPDFVAKNFNLASSNPNEVVTDTRAIPIIDYDYNNHKGWTPTKYEQYVSKNGRKIITDSLDNYFNIPESSFIVTDVISALDTINNRNDANLSDEIMEKIKNLKNQYSLNFNPNKDTGEFFQIVKIANANDLGNKRRLEHPAPYVWYLGDGINTNVSFYLMKFESPNKEYNLEDFQVNTESDSSSIYVFNKSSDFVKYTQNQHKPIKQDSNLTFDQIEKDLATKNNNMFTKLKFKIDGKVLLSDFLKTEKLLPQKLANKLLTSLGNKNLNHQNLFAAFNGSYIVYDEINHTLTFYIKTTSMNNIKIAEEFSEVLGKQNITNQSIDTTLFKEASGYWKIKLIDDATKSEGYWIIPYKQIKTDNISKFVILVNESNDGYEIKNYLLNNKYDLLDKFVKFIKTLPSSNAKNTHIVNSDNLNKSLSYFHEKQEMPFFELETFIAPQKAEITQNPISDLVPEVAPPAADELKIAPQDPDFGLKIILGTTIPFIVVVIFASAILIIKRKKSQGI